jgi:uncharacterized membrane protein
MDLVALLPLILLVAFIAGGVLLTTAAVLQKPGRLAIVLVLMICVASQPSTYGLSAPNPLGLFYVMGINTFYFSLYQLLVLTLWGVVVFFVPKPTYPDGRNPWRLIFMGYWSFGVTLMAWMLADSSPWFSNDWLMSVFWKSSYPYLLWQGIFLYIIYSTLTHRADLRRLGLLMVAAVTINHLWGMFRYVALGGDPQNAYALMEHLSVKITFWDISDSVMATFLVGYGIWCLLMKPDVKRSRRLMYAGIVLLGAASVVLSSRRTAQGGLIFALIGILICLPKGKRGIIVLVMAAMIPAALVVTAQRSKDSSGSLIDKVFLDVGTSKFENPRQSRFYEWKRAWMSLKESPVVGLGPRGSFRVIDDEGLKYHRNNFGFVHSGWGHILLKTGFLGLGIFLTMLGVFVVNVARSWSRIPDSLRPMCVGAVAALFASLPNFTVGTPIVEIRTMFVIAAMMAILMACARLARQPRDPEQHEPEMHAAHVPILSDEVVV